MAVEATTMKYRIVRMFAAHVPSRHVKTVNTIAEAQAWCSDPETSSRTCTKSAGKNRTRKYGEWFDGYQEVKLPPCLLPFGVAGLCRWRI